MEDDTISEKVSTVIATTSNLIQEFILTLNKEGKWRMPVALLKRKPERQNWSNGGFRKNRGVSKKEKCRIEDTKRDKETTRLLNLLLDKEDNAMQQQLTLADKN